MSLASLIKRLQDIMRKDSGVDGDAQRLAQIVWLIFLKVYDYKEEEAELDDDYVPVIPKGYRWRDWAVGTSVKEQMTGPDLLDFVNNKLIPALGGNPITVDVPIDENGNEITDKAKMKFAKGYKQVQKIPFDKTDDRSLLVKDVMGDATNYMKNGFPLVFGTILSRNILPLKSSVQRGCWQTIRLALHQNYSFQLSGWHVRLLSVRQAGGE